jgi:hypothetical protein
MESTGGNSDFCVCSLKKKICACGLSSAVGER